MSKRGNILVEDITTLLPKTGEAINYGMEAGWHPGAQICVWLDGNTVVNTGIGTASADVPMRADSVNLWLSTGKPIGAVAVVLLREDGLLDLDLPVAEYWPEFGANGKETITARHLLTHTAGIRTAEPASEALTGQEVTAALESARIERDWVPGKDAAYHSFAGWQVLGELVHRLSGVPFDEFVMTRIFEPLGMKSASFGVTAEDAAKLGDRLVVMHSGRRGKFEQDPSSTPGFTSRFVRPSSGLRSTASDMVRFYRMLLGLGELDGFKLLAPNVAAEIASPHRTGMMDQTFSHVMDWGLGVMLDNKIYGPSAPYGYGPHASGRAFGHGGRESSIAFADPEYDLAFAVAFNAMAGEVTHNRRLVSVTTAIYEDLGLV